jgi:hypothetical protein
VQPLSALALGREPEPNFELLRRNGWSLNMISGPYCVVWKGSDEAVFQWRDGSWQRISGRGTQDEI